MKSKDAQDVEIGDRVFVGGMEWKVVDKEHHNTYSAVVGDYLDYLELHLDDGLAEDFGKDNTGSVSITKRRTDSIDVLAPGEKPPLPKYYGPHD